MTRKGSRFLGDLAFEEGEYERSKALFGEEAVSSFADLLETKVGKP
ncbi:hypothetical protein SAMN05518800_6846 [Variovorax sp. YR752]|nr:hypothetical protein [Variovorax sp. YR752]SOE06217.1 hypothetical protein SAMN05518800_6846 [Variovorax sp. YR752]